MLPVKLPALEDLDREDIERLKHLETMMGELPANALLFTQIPGLPQAMFDLSQAILIPGDVGMELKWLVGHMSSRVAGCQFCSAHTAYNAAQMAGVGPEKFSKIWEFESDVIFSEAERAALRLAAAAGSVPNAVDQSHFDELHQYFNDKQILELISVIAMFGFMNRWNDTLAIPLKSGPLSYAKEHLKNSGWGSGKHEH